MIGKKKKTAGFVLIEILVSLLVLSAGVIFLVQSLSMITKSNQQIRDNRLAYLLIDNIYNQLYSREPLMNKDIVLDNKEFSWDINVNSAFDRLRRLTVTVSWGKNAAQHTASLSHYTINMNKNEF